MITIQSQMIKKIGFMMLLSLVIMLIFSVLSFFTIYKQVKSNCQQAQYTYGGGCLEALIKVVQDDKANIRQKNSAVWALGQLADKQALPVLEKLYQELPIQNQCRYSEYICRYEVEKAIRWCRQGNVTSWMYSSM
jgi:hypothetical protein